MIFYNHFNLFSFFFKILFSTKYFYFLSQLSEIGIDDRFIGVSKNADAASRRYIYYKGEVLELPRGLALMKKWGPLPRSLMGLVVREPFVGKPDGDEDMSVHEFFRTRFQCDEVRPTIASAR